ncbi:hypothetical protein Patl1_07340 [Pistacia atlantica]|uniref:Uncharacterized protein n=1 Tax=Pistacia atlantica TaxID=434234 RepID=A0ACC1AFP1_9ROSI|nr:hypothetical protein Patl1_07340 [Pistacia atlantica]
MILSVFPISSRETIGGILTNRIF